MITASQARERSNMSKKSVEKFIDWLGEKIAKAADDELFVYEYHGGSPCDPVKSTSIESFREFEIPPFWDRAITKLRAQPLNYMVDIKPGAPYVPRGLANDDGEGPEYVNYSMIIRW
jgi:hypothetical protein